MIRSSTWLRVRFTLTPTATGPATCPPDSRVTSVTWMGHASRASREASEASAATSREASEASAATSWKASEASAAASREASEDASAEASGDPEPHLPLAQETSRAQDPFAPQRPSPTYSPRPSQLTIHESAARPRTIVSHRAMLRDAHIRSLDRPRERLATARLPRHEV